MSKSSKTRFRALIFLALLGAVGGMIARVLISAASLDTTTAHYAQGVAAPIILHAAIAVFFAVLVCAAFLIPKKELPSAYTSLSQDTVTASVFVAFLMLAYDGVLFLRRMANSSTNAMVLVDNGNGTTAGKLFAYFLLIIAVPAALYFLLLAFKSKRIDGVLKAPDGAAFGILSAMPLLWCIAFVLNTYFENTIAFNSPIKVFRILVMLVLMFFAIQDSRMVIGIPMPRLYLISALFAVFFAPLHAVSEAILYAKGYIFLSEGYLSLGVELCYAFYILTRLFAFFKDKPQTEAETEALPADETENNV